MKYTALLFLTLVLLFVESGCVMRQTGPADRQIVDTVRTAEPAQPPGNEPSSDLNMHGKAIDIQLKGSPVYVYGVNVNASSQEARQDNLSEWTVVLEDGQLQRFQVHSNNEQVEEKTDDSTSIIPSIPHFIKPVRMQIQSGEFPAGEASRWTTPLAVRKNLQVFVNPDGEIVFWNKGEIARLPVNALPDTRILMDHQERLLVLNDPVNRYQHGILGDKTEAGGFVILDAKYRKVVRSVTIDPPDVIESLQPIWTDWDGNGEREIVLTLSNDDTGSRLALFSENGELLAEGSPLGRGHRWRDALAVAPFGLDGRMELAEVMTPHIGGILQYVQWDKDHHRLTSAASGTGYSTHEIGTRNLDLFAAADWDRDGLPELLLPNQSKNELVVVKQTEEGIENLDRLSLNGKLSTNIAALTVGKDQGLQLAAAGTKEGKLILWFN